MAACKCNESLWKKVYCFWSSLEIHE